MIKKTMRAEMRTPVVIARKAKRIRIFRATATRAPVQAPVPGSGMATRVIRHAISEDRAAGGGRREIGRAHV